MKYYEYDARGWLIGWHEDATRPGSTPIAPIMRPSRARWNGSAWIADQSREDAQVAAEADTRTRRDQAIALLRAYDPATATAADVRQALAAVIRLLPNL